MSYIVRNCPALNLPLFEDYEEPAIKNGCMQEETGCEEICNCVIKQIVRLCKENQFFNYGAVMLGNGLSADILDLLEIEEVNE